MAHRYWLMKSEPSAFSIQDLRKVRNQTTSWDGVRNFQARNFMRTMKKGDRVLFHHSSAEPPAVMGVAEVVTEAYPDDTAFDPKDILTIPGSPASLVGRWYQLVRSFVPRFRGRGWPEPDDVGMSAQGSLLSVQPVRPGNGNCARTVRILSPHSRGVTFPTSPTKFS